MTERLVRLLHHRRLDPADGSALEREAALTTPSPEMVRRLAPALGLHAADLFVIADQPVPDDLAPLDLSARRPAFHIVEWAFGLRPEQTRQLRQLAGSLPQQERAQPIVEPPDNEHYEPGDGAMLVRMLHNRNLGWSTGTKLLFVLAGVGPLSASTVGLIGQGRKELTPQLLGGFASVLGIPAGDLAALTGMEDPGARPANPNAVEVAGLLWDLRRLTAAQTEQVWDQARSMRPGGQAAR